MGQFPMHDSFEADLWLTVRFGITDWKVYLVDGNECPHLEEKYGVTIPSKALVYLDRNLEYNRLICYLGHELVHVCFADCTPELLSALLGDCGEDDTTKFEERIASKLGPALLTALVQSGFLVIPPLPERR